MMIFGLPADLVFFAIVIFRVLVRVNFQVLEQTGLAKAATFFDIGSGDLRHRYPCTGDIAGQPSSLLDQVSAVSHAHAQDLIGLGGDLWLEGIDQFAQGDNNRPLSVDEAAAELSYIFALAMASTDDDPGAQRMYALALEFNPRHAMTNNNVGYAMADRGENLDEARDRARSCANKVRIEY